MECINRDLGEIPEGIEPSTQVIDVRGNSISVLADDIFNEVSNFKIFNIFKVFFCQNPCLTMTVFYILYFHQIYMLAQIYN